MFPHVQLLEPWAASGTWNRPAGEEARMAHIKNSPLLGPDRLLKAFYVYFLGRSCSLLPT